MAAVALLLLTFGYGCVESGLGLFILNSAHLPASRIGVVLAANTTVIVVIQLFVISFVKGRSRAQMLAGVGLLWALTWALAGSSLVLPDCAGARSDHPGDVGLRAGRDPLVAGGPSPAQ